MCGVEFHRGLNTQYLEIFGRKWEMDCLSYPVICGIQRNAKPIKPAKCELKSVDVPIKIHTSKSTGSAS